MSPFAISILLHYYDHANDPAPLMGGQRWKETIDQLFADELLTDDDSTNQRQFKLTARGQVFVVEGLIGAPLPEQYWRMPNKEIPHANAH